MKLIYSISFLLSLATSLDIDQIDDIFKRSDPCTSCTEATQEVGEKCNSVSDDKILQCMCDMDDQYYQNLYDCAQNCGNSTVNKKPSSPKELREAFCKANNLTQSGDIDSLSLSSNSQTSIGSSHITTTTSSSSVTAKPGHSSSSADHSTSRKDGSDASKDSSTNAAVGLGAGSLLYILAAALL